MKVSRNIGSMVVFSDEPLSHALQKISANKMGVVFVLAQNGVLEGVLTDGDFRRWLLDSPQWDLSLPVQRAINTHFVAALENTPVSEIELLFSTRVRYVPLVDRQQRLVGIAAQAPKELVIDKFRIADDSPSFLIAEIGNNHQGSLEMARHLIDEAVSAGADCVKFQMRHAASMYQPDNDLDEGRDLGAEYTLDLLKRFQLSDVDMCKAFDHCKERGILPLCTPWDGESLVVLERYGMTAYKVASADLTNHELLTSIGLTGKPILCSTGMSSEAEIKQAVHIFRKCNASYALLHCNSTYPTPLKDVNLNYLSRLKLIGNGCQVGYSGHERGFYVPVAAVCKGARIIEKHFTLDRNLEGNDHRVSLLPHEFGEMVRTIRQIEESFGSGDIRRITQGETMNREILAKSLAARRALQIGHRIIEADIDTRTPGSGLSPNHRSDLVGRLTSRALEAGELFYPSDLRNGSINSRNYSFNRPFGIPVRYHDIARMVDKSNIDLVEFHFSYRDMDLNPSQYLDSNGYALDFVVHSPELFAGDHLLDLRAEDPEYRNRSMRELQRVIDRTRDLKKYFKRAERPKIVVNAGGFTLDRFIPIADRAERYARIGAALTMLDTEGVEILPQTMPPFPWHFGGQRFHNLFIDASDIQEFCNKYGMRICLDISHSMLACNLANRSFKSFLEEVAPHAAHLHLVDAEGTDGEGLQIGEGSIDFAVVAAELNRLCPTASFIPEIWQGHKNDGEGFWIALDRLEKILS
jgi:N-acetylneuraminate synthase